MITKCLVCKKTYKVKYIVGLKYIPDVCSVKCLFEFLYDVGVDMHLFLNNLKTITEPLPIATDYKSNLERKFVSIAHKYGFICHYEPFMLKYSSKRYYIPDFVIYKNNHVSVVEIKGKWEKGAYVKAKSAHKIFSELGIPYFIITENKLK